MKTEVTIIRKEVLKKLVACLLLFQLIIACETNKPTEVVEKPLPKIAIAGLAIESSTFSPAPRMAWRVIIEYIPTGHASTVFVS